MTTYYIELNGKYIEEYKRKSNAFKWVERHVDIAKRYVDLEEYPELIRIWEHKGREGNECIYEIKLESN